MDKSTLASWADMLQEGIDCVKLANTMQEGDAQKKFFGLGIDFLEELRDEILQAKHHTIK